MGETQADVSLRWSSASPPNPPHCNPLLFTVMYCNPLQSTVMHCNPLQSTVMRYSSIMKMHCNQLLSTTMRSTPWQSITFYCDAVKSAIQCDALTCTVITITIHCKGLKMQGNAHQPTNTYLQSTKMHIVLSK